MTQKQIGAELFRLLQRHFVALRVTIGTKAAHRCVVLSAFILSVDDVWVLVTAGHCLDEIDSAIQAGSKILSCEILDDLVSSSVTRGTIPLNYDHAWPISTHSEGFDCGILRLNSNQRLLLASNQKQPLTEDVWEKQSNAFDLYLLVGIPSELTVDAETYTRVTPSLNVVTEVDRDEPFDEPKFPTFYGKVDLGDELGSIAGMSGGPVFGFRYLNGEVRYWLVALLSGWNRSDRRVVAPKTRNVGLMIRHAISQ